MTTQDKIKAVLELHPRLTTGGYLPRTEPDKMSFAHFRDFMSDETAAQFEAACRFIDAAGTTQNVSKKSPYSYHMKHVAERWAETYIANGVFIAAALHMGAPVLPDGGRSPNASIGLSKMGIARLANLQTHTCK